MTNSGRSAQRPVRNIDIGSLQDAILISAAGTIIVIRLQLWATNYPQLGGGGLHIAHLLWGGLFMLAAIGMLVSFLGRGWRMAAAVLGGVGFGFFIDEVGKFVTSDNNYFFKPTAAIIYIVFILLYFITRRMQSQMGFSERENLANAFDLVATATHGGLRTDDRARALALLEQSGESPLVEPLRELVRHCDAIAPPEPGRLRRAWERMGARAAELTAHRRFQQVLIWAFALWAAVTLIEAFGLVAAIGLKLSGIGDLSHSLKLARLSIPDVASLCSSAVAAVLIGSGIAKLRRGDRAAGYRMFARAMMVDIFITQVFIFVQSSFSAVAGLLFSLALLVTVRRLEGHESPPAAVAPGGRIDELAVPGRLDVTLG